MSRWGNVTGGDVWLFVGILFLVIVAVALLVLLLPVPTRGLGARPNPSADYADATARFDRLAAAEAPLANPAIRSLLLTHGGPTRRVYVFVHGITNSPRQFEELGHLLHARGHNVLIPMLPRHGRRSMRLRELRGLRAEEFRDYADATVDIAAGLGQEIIAIGISGGASVVGWMAQNRAEMDTGLLLAPFVGVPRVHPFVGTVMANAYSRVPSFNIEDPLEPRRDWVYRGQTTRALAETLRLGRAIFRQARHAAPLARRIIILTTARETQVSNAAAARLAALWRARGANVEEPQFAAELAIPHNAIDPAADPAKKAIVYARMLELLGETS